MAGNEVSGAQRERAKRRGGRRGTVLLWWRLLAGVRRQGWGETTGYLFVLPGATLFLIFRIYPMYRGLWMAFTDYRFMLPGYHPFVGLGNFREFLTNDSYFWPSLGRTLYFTGIYFPLLMTSSLLAATFIAKVQSDFVSGFYRTIIYLPVILPMAVAILMWNQFYATQFGFINLFIKNTLHLPRLTQRWLQDPRWTIPCVTVASLWKHFGYATMLLLIGMYNINRELYEAAEIDGATGWQQWRFITFPLLKPTLTLVLVLHARLFSAAQEFMIMYGQGFGPMDSALTLGYYIWTTAFRWGQLRMGYAASMSLFLGIISMVLTASFFRLLRTERA